MKTIIILCLGACMGAFGMRYSDDVHFAKQVNAQVSASVDSAATSVHKSLQSATK